MKYCILSEQYKKTNLFLTKRIWKLKREETGAVTYICVNLLKKVILAIEFTTERRITSAASALSYSTLFAIVPILAVVFAIARGFGYNKYIELWFRESLSSQPQAAETIIGFVNSYLAHTQSGIILGIGLVFMLFSVLMLIRNIEQTFNFIWQVKKPRSMFRTITDYTSLLLLVPLVIVITSGLSIFLATVSKSIEDTLVIGTLMRIIIQIMQYILMSGVFTALYIFMPNTRVKISSALPTGIIAGVAMQGLQLFYIHSQIWVSSYNAIYGSFAALPLFMLWVQLSWLICLFGAELCYATQNMEEFAFMNKVEDISHRYKLLLCIIIMSHICKRFKDGGKPYSAFALKIETKIPIRLLNELLYNLVRIHMLTEITNNDKGETTYYQPAECLSRLSVGTLIDRFEAEGKWDTEIALNELNNSKLSIIIKSRAEYLKIQKSILLQDLLDK